MEQAGTANLGVIAYAGALTVGGIGLGILNAIFSWHFALFIVAAVLCFAGVAMLVTRLRGGAKLVRFSCPLCSESQLYAQSLVTEGRVFPCSCCAEYLHVSDGEPNAVAPDLVLPEAIFEAPIPSGAISSSGCMVCGAPPVLHETIGGKFKRGKTLITYTVEAPLCDAHAQGEHVRLRTAEHIPGQHHLAMMFRSHTAMQRFREEHPATLRVVHTKTFQNG